VVTTGMRKKILSFLKTLPVRELKQFRKVLDQIIQQKLNSELQRRNSQRAKVTITATANIERESEFFHQEHRITIHDLSTSGMLFTTEAPIINNDILAITFRSPTNGEQRSINCQAVRVKENHQHSHWEYEVGAKSVDRQAVRAYREMLKNRGRF
jgi:PilZ domain-containing protein